MKFYLIKRQSTTNKDKVLYQQGGFCLRSFRIHNFPQGTPQVFLLRIAAIKVS